MKIKRDGIEILDVVQSDKSVEKYQLMETHSVSINFELSTLVNLYKGDYITYNGNNYYLKSDYVHKINPNTGGYVYDLEFFSKEERFKDFLLKYNGNTEFQLTVTGTQHLKLISDNLIECGLGTYNYSTISEIKTIDYKDTSIFDALTLIAETYELEWWISGNTINLGRCEFGSPVILEYDKELDSINFSESSERLITRLYAFGGTKNMPSGKRLSVPCVDLYPDLPQNQLIEGVKYFEDIYPRQVSTITALDSYIIEGEGQDTTIYRFKGGLVLTQADLLPGEVLKVNFTSGSLNGREFELIIDGEWYEIKYEQEGDLYFPNPNVCPQIGDSFFLSGFNAESVMPELVTAAQSELSAAARNYLDSIGSGLVYEVKTRSIYCEEHNINLSLGQVVTIRSNYLGEITSRVRGYEKIIGTFEATYTIGNFSKYSRLDNIETSISNYSTLISSKEGVSLNALLRLFLSKTNDDTAQGLIKFLKGIEIGEFIPGMFGGKGAKIDSLGNIEAMSARLRGALEAPEYRFNRLTVIGDELILTESGMFKSIVQIADRSYEVYMQLEEGEAIAFQPGDLIKGIFHQGFGFSTSFMRVEEIGQTFMKVTLAADVDTPTQANFPPQPFMKIARVGNVSDPERQRYMVFSTKLGGYQLFDGCSDFLNGQLVASFDTAQSFKSLFGELPLKENLPYVYAAGLVVQDIIRVDYQGLPIREVNDRGPWQPGVTYYNNNTAGTDDVWHLGCRWRCFSSSTTEEPSWMSAAWTMIEGRSDARMEFDSSNGFAFFAGQVDTTITPVVLIGNANVSNDIVEEQWSWTRTSGDQTADTIWNLQHVGVRVLELRNEDMGNLWSKTNPVRFTCTAIYPASTINEITNYIEV